MSWEAFGSTAGASGAQASQPADHLSRDEFDGLSRVQFEGTECGGLEV